MATRRPPMPDAQSPEIVAAMRQIDRLIRLVGEPVTITSTQVEPRELHNWDLVAPAMLFSAASCLLSLRYLAEAPAPRRDQDASVLLRRLYEHAVDFAWIAIDPGTNAPRWVADDFYYRLKLDDDFVQLGRGALSADKRQSYQAYVDAHRGLPQVLQRAEAADRYWSTRIEQHGTFPQVAAPDGQDLAQTQNGRWSLRAAYAFIYRAGSAIAHPTPSSLFDYVWPGGASGTFTIGMNTGAVNRYAYTMAPLIFAPMLLIAEQVLGRPKANDVYAAFGT